MFFLTKKPLRAASFVLGYSSERLFSLSLLYYQAKSCNGEQTDEHMDKHIAAVPMCSSKENPAGQPEASPCVRGKDFHGASGKKAGPGVYFRVTFTEKSEK